MTEQAMNAMLTMVISLKLVNHHDCVVVNGRKCLAAAERTAVLVVSGAVVDDPRNATVSERVASSK